MDGPPTYFWYVHRRICHRTQLEPVEGNWNTQTLARSRRRAPSPLYSDDDDLFVASLAAFCLSWSWFESRIKIWQGYSKSRFPRSSTRSHAWTCYLVACFLLAARVHFRCVLRNLHDDDDDNAFAAQTIICAIGDVFEIERDRKETGSQFRTR